MGWDALDLFRLGMEAKEAAELGVEDTALGPIFPDDDVDEDEGLEGVEFGLDEASYLAGELFEDGVDGDDDYEGDDDEW